MKLTKHWHYLLLLFALLVLNGFTQSLGQAVGGNAGEFVVAAAFGFGFITVMIMWIVFAFSKDKHNPQNEKIKE
ncbi:hypothetical protein COY62_03655 [bacterium (Candidatus Howlettbacteria) CG_4_10_14_0_8_um_filter_40_9]|nr:MAG: hypothetical protein COY62_03655 [bacterium (Candidatus Howlettbacteria) CG_4_10_14_0_8_um_filter_40_9]